MLTKSGEAAQLYSNWDEQLPNIEMHNVHIDKTGIVGAWQEMATKYLLRANFYMDAIRDADSRRFTFDKESTTVKDIFNAFVTTYPAYTYAQDEKTGVIWIYPKKMTYVDLLNAKVRIDHSALQIPMYDGVLLPLCKLTSTNGIIAQYFVSSLMVVTCNYGVDLPTGTFSVRDILNFCCVPNISAAFFVSPAGSLMTSKLIQITPVNLLYDNPMVPPRTAACVFWEMEVGKTQIGTPNLAEIATALGDSDPQKRMAALSYIKAASVNYETENLMDQNDDPQNAIWAAIELKSFQVMNGEQPFLTRHEKVMRLLSNALAHQNPGLALLASMEVAREKNDATAMDLVADHNFSTAEIAIIKPELIRIARQSKLVRDKLSKMKFDDPELSPDALHELEDTNLFTLISTKANSAK